MVSSSYGGTIRDNFDDNYINPGLWTVEVWGNGPTVAETNQRLEITIPADAIDIMVGLYLKFIILGDFDEQIDFNLLEWPTGNGMAIGLGTGFLFNIYRKSFGPEEGGPKEEYFISCLGGVLNNLATTDTAGKLRLKRTGNKMEGFYWQAGGWQTLGSFAHPVFDTELELSIEALSMPFTRATRPIIQIAFNNYQVTNKNIGNCPPFLPLLLD
jgi:hypothetical protein